MQIGAYEVLGEIARGGAGVVYRARHMTHGTPVAIKVLQLQSTPDYVERFLREAHVTFRLRHPHVVGLLEWGQHQAHPYLVLELIEGQSLEERLREQGPLPARQIFQLGRQIADALHYAHGLGLVHRDIKPANILLEARTGRAVLTDFGIAQVEGTSGERLTVTGEVLGTPAYMSPEQARGTPGDTGPPSDVYSLGATLYAALCGRPPVTETSPIAAMAQVMTEAPPHPKDVYPAAHPELTEFVLRCLEKNPHDRFRTAAALRDALADASRTGTVGATGANRIVERRGSSLVLAVVAAALAAFGGWGLGRLQGSDSSAPLPTTGETPQPALEPPPPSDPPREQRYEIGTNWLVPFSTLARLREQAQTTKRWEAYAQLAEHYERLKEDRLALDSIDLALSAADSATDRFNLTYLRGKLHARLDQPRLVLEDAAQLLEQDREHPFGWNLKALALQDTGDFAGAFEAAERAIRAGGNASLEGRLIQAHGWRLDGRKQDTLRAIQALEEDGLDLTSLLRMRVTLAPPQEKQRLLEEIGRRATSDANFWRERAFDAVEERNWDSVVECGLTAYRLAPSDFTSISMLLTALTKQERWDDAIRLAKDVVEHAPPALVAGIQARLAYAYSRQNAVGNAQKIQRLTEAFRKGNSGARWLIHAQANLLQQTQDAVRLLQWLQPLSRYPGEPTYPVAPDVRLLEVRALAERIVRDSPRGHLDLMDRATLNRETIDYSALGMAFLREELPVMAHRAFRLEEDSGQTTDSLQAGLGVCQLLMGQPKQAVAHFRRGNVVPRDSTLVHMRAVAYARALRLSGDEEGAKRLLRRAFRKRLAKLPSTSAADLERTLIASLKQSAREAIQAGRPSSTVIVLDELMILEPNDLELRVLAVALTRDLANSQTLGSLAARLLSYDPQLDPKLLLDLAQIVSERRPGLAALLLSEGLRREPANHEVRFQACKLYCLLNLFAAAEQLADEGLQQAPDTRLLALRGIARAVIQHPDAEQDLRRAHEAGLQGTLAEDTALALGKLVSLAGSDPSEALELLSLPLASERDGPRASARVHAMKAMVDRRSPEDEKQLLPLMEATWQGLRTGAYLSPADRRELSKVQLQVFGQPR